MIVPVVPPFSVVAVIWAPVATGWRAICPITCDGSVKAPALIEVSGRVIVFTWSALMRVDSGMSAAATTTGPSVGGLFVALSLVGVRTSNRMPTKATIARKTPTSRTSRLERFKLVLPDEMV